jgi:hypothetical protein
VVLQVLLLAQVVVVEVQVDFVQLLQQQVVVAV